MSFNSESLKSANDAAIAAGGLAIGALLYQNPSRQSEPFVHNGSGVFELTASTPALKVATAKRVQLQGGLAPNMTGLEYFMHAVPGQPNQFELMLTKADALAGIGAVVPSAPISNATIFDLAIQDSDSVLSLVSYELSYSGYGRNSSSFSPSVYNPTQDEVSAPAGTQTFPNNSGGYVPVSHLLVLIGGSLTVGSTNNSYYGLTTVSGSTIADGSSLVINIRQKAKSF